MKKLFFLMLSALLLPFEAFAQNATSQELVNSAAQGAYGGQPNNFTDTVGLLLQVLFSMLGLVLLGYLIVGGVFYMTAGGNEDQVKRAKNMLRNSVIGIIIILTSLAISNFVIRNIESATTSSSDAGQEQTTP